MPQCLLTRNRNLLYLLICLVIQAALLFPALGLLPTWGDEAGTVRISTLPLQKIPRLAFREYHPPLYYYVVHFWLLLPLPGTPVERVRALSVLLTLFCTMAVYRLWLQRWACRPRIWFLGLWTFSPFLILYSRMARPYSLQMFVGCIALYLGMRLAGPDVSVKILIGYAVVTACLLYTHYAPGTAVAAGVSFLLLAKGVHLRRSQYFWKFAGANFLISLLYLPWVESFIRSVERTGNLWKYNPSRYSFLNHPIKLSYWFTSFTFGETLPVWALPLAVCLTPLVGWILYRAVRQPPEWLGLAAAVTAVGYAGVSQWMSFAFVPARLIVIYPFYLMLFARGVTASKRSQTLMLILLPWLSGGSLLSYYHKENFLNKAYVVPYREIAAVIDRQSNGSGGILIADSFNGSVWPLLEYLPSSIHVLRIGKPRPLPSILEMAKPEIAETIWVLRNTHDVSPNRLVTQLQAALRKGRAVKSYSFVPYSTVDRIAMRLLGWEELPRYALELLEMRKVAGSVK